MKLLLTLPTSLVVLTWLRTAGAQEERWPYNLPRTAKYYPEDEAKIRRGLEVQQKLEWQSPIGVKKLSDDPGEKFLLDYWDFGGMGEEHGGGSSLSGALRRPSSPNYWNECANASSRLPLLPALIPHTNHGAAWGRNLFARAFQCPSGTSSCSSIGQPDLCCQTGEQCVTTSSGTGCCPSGETCGDTVASCDTGAGYTSCPQSSNGGCCVPGASCYGDGCVFYGTETVTTTLPVATVTAGTSTAAASETSTPGLTPSAYITTQTVTVVQGGITLTTTIVVPTTVYISVAVSSTLVCSTGFFSCPASLGGGCCATGQACASNHQCPDISTSTATSDPSPNPAVRPTTVAPSPSSSETVIYSGCPTGYYMCSAVYLGGCCQVGRNCETTSCPAADSTNVITSGVTIGAPSATGAGGASVTGTCAGGWYSCAATDGGGCCPSGYSCGTASCAPSVSGVASQPKELPSGGNGIVLAWTVLGMGLTAGLGMILL